VPPGWGGKARGLGLLWMLGSHRSVVVQAIAGACCSTKARVVLGLVNDANNLCRVPENVQALWHPRPKGALSKEQLPGIPASC
jgi:hypothetical protein